MNNTGNIMINLLVFILAVGIFVAFISPLTSFVNIAQQSNGLNCQGYIDASANGLHNYSFNGTLTGGASGSPLACIAIRLYLPYLLLAFLIGAVAKILSNQDSSGAEGYFGG